MRFGGRRSWRPVFGVLDIGAGRTSRCPYRVPIKDDGATYPNGL